MVTGDVGTFLALFVVMLLSYGVFVDALLYPHTERGSREEFRSAVTRPVFQVFGELFLDELSQESECIGTLPFTDCGESLHDLVPVITAIYIFVSNVVLMNLLIAMFASTYARVSEISFKYYQLKLQDLLSEYKKKQPLPPPLSTITIFFYWMRKLAKAIDNSPETRDIQRETIKTIKTIKTMKTMQTGVGGADAASRIISIHSDKDDPAAGKENVEWAQRRLLELFEEKHTDRYMEELVLAARSTDAEKLNRLDSELHRLSSIIAELHRTTHQMEIRAHHIPAMIRRNYEHAQSMHDVVHGALSAQNRPEDDAWSDGDEGRDVLGGLLGADAGVSKRITFYTQRKKSPTRAGRLSSRQSFKDSNEFDIPRGRTSSFAQENLSEFVTGLTDFGITARSVVSLRNSESRPRGFQAFGRTDDTDDADAAIGRKPSSFGEDFDHIMTQDTWLHALIQQCPRLVEQLKVATQDLTKLQMEMKGIEAAKDAIETNITGGVTSGDERGPKSAEKLDSMLQALNEKINRAKSFVNLNKGASTKALGGINAGAHYAMAGVKIAPRPAA